MKVENRFENGRITGRKCREIGRVVQRAKYSEAEKERLLKAQLAWYNTDEGKKYLEERDRCHTLAMEQRAMVKEEAERILEFRQQLIDIMVDELSAFDGEITPQIVEDVIASHKDDIAVIEEFSTNKNTCLKKLHLTLFSELVKRKKEFLYVASPIVIRNTGINMGNFTDEEKENYLIPHFEELDLFNDQAFVKKHCGHFPKQVNVSKIDSVSDMRIVLRSCPERFNEFDKDLIYFAMKNDNDFVSISFSNPRVILNYDHKQIIRLMNLKRAGFGKAIMECPEILTKLNNHDLQPSVLSTLFQNPATTKAKVLEAVAPYLQEFPDLKYYLVKDADLKQELDKKKVQDEQTIDDDGMTM